MLRGVCYWYVLPKEKVGVKKSGSIGVSNCLDSEKHLMLLVKIAVG